MASSFRYWPFPQTLSPGTEEPVIKGKFEAYSRSDYRGQRLHAFNTYPRHRYLCILPSRFSITKAVVRDFSSLTRQILLSSWRWRINIYNPAPWYAFSSCARRNPSAA